MQPEPKSSQPENAVCHLTFTSAWPLAPTVRSTQTWKVPASSRTVPFPFRKANVPGSVVSVYIETAADGAL